MPGLEVGVSQPVEGLWGGTSSGVEGEYGSLSLHSD